MPPGFKKRPTGHEQRLKSVNFSREKNKPGMSEYFNVQL